MNPKNNFAFFGSDEFSIAVVEKLLESNLRPSLIITMPDAPKGRKMILTPTPLKVWAESQNIEVITPVKLDDTAVSEIQNRKINLGLVASYGKIIPQKIIDAFSSGILNIHPSLLPEWRGASPVESVILHNQKSTGVTLMLMDAGMDHGPIIDQVKFTFENWPAKTEVYKTLADLGATLFINNYDKWLAGEITPTDQNHDSATFTKKIKKEDGLIDLTANSDQEKWLKYIAYKPWPGIYFMQNDKRVKINEASWQDEKFIINKVTPEGSREMSYEDYLRGLK